MELMGNGVVLEVPLGLPNDLRLPGASGHGRRGYKRCVSHLTSSMGKRVRFSRDEDMAHAHASALVPVNQIPPGAVHHALVGQGVRRNGM
jgi:hypothetical protein